METDQQPLRKSSNHWRMFDSLVHNYASAHSVGGGARTSMWWECVAINEFGRRQVELYRCTVGMESFVQLGDLVRSFIVH